MKRYMVIEHPESAQTLSHDECGKVCGQIPVHHLLKNYHWSRLDDGHVIVLGEYSHEHHDKLHKHDQVAMLPHLGSTKSVKEHLHGNNKHKFHKALKCTKNVEDHHTMSDLLEHIEAHHGPIFAPDK